MPQENEPSTNIFSELGRLQERRDNLMKWKLVVIAGIGTGGLGIMGNSGDSKLQLILAVIPLACVYIDLLCRTMSIRSKRIAYFISTLSANDAHHIDADFIKFYQRVKKKSGNSLESYTLLWSTLLLSVIITCFGIFGVGNCLDRIMFFASGVLSILLSVLVQRRYNFEKSTIELVHEAETK